MTGDPEVPDPAELVRLGLVDPDDPGAEDRIELIRYAMARGATAEDVAGASNLGELAVDFVLRPRLGPTLEEFVADAGIAWEKAERLLTATGLPVHRDQRITAAEADTIRLLTHVSDQLLGEEATQRLGRVAGAAMARLAEAIVTTFRLEFELPHQARGTPYPEVVKEYAEIANAVLPGFVGSLDVLLRQQILAVAERVWATDEDRSVVTLPRTIGFADLVGYTAAASVMSVRELTEVLAAFEDITADIALEGNGQIVKTIGDEAMFVTEDSADACHIALAMVGACDRDGVPPVRVGLAAGDVVAVFGDVYGPDVNLAARLVGVAEPSAVVVSDRVRSSCDDAFEFEALAPVTLKGFAEPITAHRLVGAR